MSVIAIGVVSGLTIAALWVFGCSLLREPQRRVLNTLLIGVAAGAYGNHQFGPLEALGTLTLLFLGFLAFKDYRFLAAAWLVHTAIDVAHHLNGDPMFSYFPASSVGCAVTDPILAMWFWHGARPLSVALSMRGQSLKKQ